VSVFNTDPEECQAYIEKEVSVGDPITADSKVKCNTLDFNE
jgi:hypothetical protein